MEIKQKVSIKYDTPPYRGDFDFTNGERFFLEEKQGLAIYIYKANVIYKPEFLM